MTPASHRDAPSWPARAPWARSPGSRPSGSPPPAPYPAARGSTVPATVSAGQAGGDGWDAAVSILKGYDRHAVFSNPFLDSLMG